MHIMPNILFLSFRIYDMHSMVDLTPCFEKNSKGIYECKPICTTGAKSWTYKSIKKGVAYRTGPSVAEVTFQLPTNWGNKAIITSKKGKAARWGSLPQVKYQYIDGQRRLIMRMLRVPLKLDLRKKVDCHVWPERTFLQINGVPIPPQYIRQRKQQSHDLSEWKGMCAPLDLTPFVKNPERKNTLTLFTSENYMSCKYAIQICLAEYRTPETLTKMLLSTDIIQSKSDIRLRRICYKSSVELAKRYVKNQTIVLDNVGGGYVAMPLVFQITCPISMTPLTVPVRGARCKHMQCMDLSHFLHTNSFPSGRRWKCVICDELISPDSIVLCGLFKKMVSKHADEARNGRDKIEFCANGSWILKPEEKKRPRKSVAMKSESDVSSSKRKRETDEIILSD